MTASINFPARLPRPSLSFSGKKTSGVTSTRFASGLFRQRNNFNDKRREASITLELEEFDFSYFQGWWNDVLSNGSLSFNIDLYLDGGGLQSFEATPINGEYGFKHQGVGTFVVSFKALLLDQNYLSGEVIELLEDEGDTFEDLLTLPNSLEIHNSNLEPFINTTLPQDYT